MDADYIDIHRHQNPKATDSNAFTIFNKHENFSSVSFEKQYSVGIHPWYIENGEEQIAILKKNILLPNVIAIGECGLDRHRGASLEIQREVFQQQIILANEYKKPLIIHCVRAFPEVLALLKQAKVPVIFHGFNKRNTIANEILQQGYYLSFGADLMKDNTAAHAVFAGIPANRFFLETDDAQIDIKEIYQTATHIRKTEEEAIILQLKENFKTVFNL